MVMGLKGNSGTADSRPLTVSSSVGYEIHEFLAWEALLLDHQRYVEWAALLSRDLRYRGPIELFFDAAASMQQWQAHPHVEKDHNFIITRVRDMEPQLSTAASKDISTHVHRLITNVIVSPAHCPREFVVTSYVLVTCARENETESKLLTVERTDRLRRGSESFQIARREIRIAHIPAQMRPAVSFL